MTLLQWLALPFIGLTCLIAPGYVLRLLFASSARPEPAPWWTVAFEVVLASVLWTGACGILLLQFGVFSLPRLITGNLLLTGVSAFVVWRRGGRWRPGVARLPRAGWVPLALIAGAGALFFHPHEFIYGGADAGVYVNLAQSIVRHGSWVIQEPIIEALPDTLYPAFFREQPPTQAARYLHVPGFYLTDPSSGEITPQFYPLHPLWLAIANAVGGLRLTLFVTPLWGLLGTAAVAFVAETLFGKRCGVLTFIFLTLTATQVWFSRYPTTEVLTQFLVFGGIWALIRYMESGSLWYALLSGAAFGQATFARPDVYFLMAIPLIYGVYRAVVARLVWKDWALVGLVGIGSAHSLVFAVTQSWPYFSSIYGALIARIVDSPLIITLVGSAVLAVGLGCWWWRRRHTESQHQRWLTSAAVWWRRVWRVLAALVVVGAVYAYFLRPVIEDTSTTWYYWYGDSNIPNVEPYNMVRLGWYLTPLGLVLATLGLWHLMNRGPDARTTLLVSVGLFFSILFIARTRNNPHHIYVMRRYVPVVIPFLVMMAAYALDRVWRRATWWRLFGAGVGIVLGVWLLASAWLQIIHVEYDGLIVQVDALVEDLGALPAIILFNDDLPVSTGALLGTPLHYLYGFTVLDLQEEYVDPVLLADQVAHWRAAGLRVVLAEGPYAVPDTFSRMSTMPLAHIQASYPVLEVSYEHKPAEIWEQTLDVRFSEVVSTP